MGKIGSTTCRRWWVAAAILSAFACQSITDSATGEQVEAPGEHAASGTPAPGNAASGRAVGAPDALAAALNPVVTPRSRAELAAHVEQLQGLAGEGFSLVRGAAGALVASNQPHHFDTSWSGKKLALTGSQLTSPWKLELELVSIARTGVQLPAELQREAEGNALHITREGGVTEWYKNGPLGLEQGFELESAPDELQRKEGKALRLTLGHSGSLLPLQEAEGIAFYTLAGKREMVFGDLVAIDATGAELESRMELSGGEIALIINDQDAIYPVQVDPLLAYSSMDARMDSGTPLLDGQFAVSIDVSGSTAIVGAPKENGGAGAAHVYVLSGSTWSLEQTLVGAAGVNNDYFGWSVAIDGDLAIVGAYGRTSNAGAAYVFARTGTTWSEVESVTNPGVSYFGYAVDIRGTRLLVSALGSIGDARVGFVFDGNGSDWTPTATLTDPTPIGPNVLGTAAALGDGFAVIGNSWDSSSAGAAIVFDEGSPSWTATRLDNTELAAGDLFGYSVAASDTRVVVGSRQAAGDDRGAAYVFRNSGGWTLDARLAADDPTGANPEAAEAGLFGTSVAISGSRIVVGAPQGTADRIGGGTAYVFDLIGGEWIQGRHFFSGSGLSGGKFGRSVSIDGDLLTVGSYVEDSGATRSGTAYAVSLAPDPAVAFERLLGSKSDGVDGQGYSVAVRGDIAVVGAPEKDGARGAAYVYAFAASAWTEIGYLESSTRYPTAQFGGFLAISGDTIYVSAPDENSRAGAVYTFAISSISGDTTETLRLASPAQVSGARFGSSLAADGDTLVVGASRRNSSTGAAYVFERTGAAWDTGTPLAATGLATSAQYGGSVSVAGDVAVVGAPGLTSNTGKVFVFRRGETTWDPADELTQSPAIAGDRFGTSVSVSGTDILVGADQTGVGPGGAYVFSYNEGSLDWVQGDYLEAPAPEQSTSKRIGISVSLDRTQALVGGAAKAFLFGKAGGSWALDSTFTSGVEGSQGASVYGAHVLLGLRPVGAAMHTSTIDLNSDCASNSDCGSNHCVSGFCVECTDATAEADCDDGLFCNGVETCSANTCIVGSNDVDDGIDCTADACDEIEDLVTHTPVDADCSDGDACTGVETCDAVSGCLAGTPPVIDDGVGCTVDVCNPDTGAVSHTANNSTCSDGNACTGVEYCDTVLDCQSGVPLQTDDGVPCTTDACNPSTGQITHVPNHSVCDNGDSCDGSELCDVTLGCRAGTNPLNCDDSVACTVDTCSQSTCVNTPNDGSCNPEGSCETSGDCTYCGTAEQQCDKILGSLGCDSTCVCQPGFLGDGTNCMATCGDGKLVAGEVCDTNAFAFATCESEGSATGSGGKLRCSSDCRSVQSGGCDRDGDAVTDENDNCPAVANPDQLDSDGDASSAGGDACDVDDDNDGVNDDEDPAPLSPEECGDSDGDSCDDCSAGAGFAPSNDGKDTDGDGVCDQGTEDWDGDSVANMNDNCPEVANATQADIDDDGFGDACDEDRDGDGVDDNQDLCPDVPDPAQRDTDNDGSGDFCDDAPGEHVASVWLTPGAATTVRLGTLTVTAPPDAVTKRVRLVVYEGPTTPMAPPDAASDVYTIETSSALSGELSVCFDLDAAEEGAVQSYDADWTTLVPSESDPGEACAALSEGSPVVALSAEDAGPPASDDDMAGDDDMVDASAPADGGMPDGIRPDLLKDGGINPDDLTDEEKDFLRDAGINPDDIDDLQDLLNRDGGLSLDGGFALPEVPSIDTGCGCRIAKGDQGASRGGLWAVVLLGGVCVGRLRRKRAQNGDPRATR